jgi:hypothetical protein
MSLESVTETPFSLIGVLTTIIGVMVVTMLMAVMPKGVMDAYRNATGASSWAGGVPIPITHQYAGAVASSEPIARYQEGIRPMETVQPDEQPREHQKRDRWEAIRV